MLLWYLFICLLDIIFVVDDEEEDESWPLLPSRISLKLYYISFQLGKGNLLDQSLWVQIWEALPQ